jgi:tetratricopeptide (TPR) repeat protein
MATPEVVPALREGQLANLLPAEYRQERLEELTHRLKATAGAKGRAALQLRARWLAEAAEHLLFLGFLEECKARFSEAAATWIVSSDCRGQALAMSNFGVALAARGCAPEAVQYLQQAISLFRLLAQTEPASDETSRELSRTHLRLGEVLWSQGEMPRALASFRASLSLSEDLAQKDSPDSRWQADFVEALTVMLTSPSPAQPQDQMAVTETIKMGLALADRLERTGKLTQPEQQSRLEALRRHAATLGIVESEALAARGLSAPGA